MQTYIADNLPLCSLAVSVRLEHIRLKLSFSVSTFSENEIARTISRFQLKLFSKDWTEKNGLNINITI